MNKVTSVQVSHAPRALLGPFEIQCQHKNTLGSGKNIQVRQPFRWVLPGRKVMSTNQLASLAMRNDWSFTILD